MIRSLLLFFFFLPQNLEEKIKEASLLENDSLKISYYKNLLPEYSSHLDSISYIQYKIALRYQNLASQNFNYLDSAIDYYNQSLKYFSVNDNYCRAGLNAIYLANCYRNKGNLPRSFSILSNYHYAIQPSDYHDYLISLSEGLKSSNNDQLNLSLLKFIRKIISLPEVFDIDLYIDNSINLSTVDTINKNPAAIKYLEEALEKVNSNDLFSGYKLRLYNELGIRHAEYKNYNAAEKYYLMLNDPSDVNQLFKMRMHNNLADLYTKKKSYYKAIKHNRLAYELLSQDINALLNDKAKNILGLSKIYFFQNKLDLSLKYANQSISVCPIEKNNLQEIIDRMIFRNSIISKLYKDSFNLTELQKIDSLMDFVRKHQADAITKVEYRKLSIDFYKKAAYDCINHNKLNEALYFKEKAKGILLAEDYLQLSNEREIIKFKYFADSISNKENISLSTIERGFYFIEPVVNAMASKYYQVRNMNNQFFKYSINQIISTNKSDHAYLDYFFTDEELLVFKITNKIEIHRLKIHPEIKDITEAYINAIKNKGDLCLGPIIYDALIKPLGSLPKNLTIIPDSYLSFLPFEALYAGTNVNEEVYKTYDFMILNHNIKYNYSLSMQALMRDKISKGKENFVFVPSFSESDNGITYGEERQSLLPLKYATEEAKDVNQYYKTTTFFNAEASKYNFLKSLSQAKFIHFTGHAIINPNDHHLSFLAFGSDDNEAHRLYLKDLSGLTTSAEMIVLSACETASGKYAPGEGLLSLGRAMVACGSKSVLTSLWNVNDWSGQQIMANYYKRLKEGLDKSQALSMSKKDYLMKKKGNMHNHPYHWSAIIFIGDHQPLADDSYSIWIKIAVILGVMAILFFVYQWSKIKVS